MRIFYIILLLLFNIINCDTFNSFSMQLKNNYSYQNIKNLKKIHFSKIEKIALFIYKSGEIDIVSNNISLYYKKIYNNSITK